MEGEKRKCVGMGGCTLLHGAAGVGCRCPLSVVLCLQDPGGLPILQWWCTVLVGRSFAVGLVIMLVVDN